MTPVDQVRFRSATRATIVLTILAAAVCSLTLHGAPPKILVVNVQDWRGRPKPGVTIAPAGSGSLALTDDAGRGQIRLSDATEAGSFVTLRVVRPDDLRVVAPPRGRTPVPKFDGSSDSYVDVILMTYADAAALESPTVLADLVARSVAPPVREASPSPPRPPAQPQRGRPGAFIFGGHMVLASLSQQQGGPVSAPGVAPLVTDSAARELGFTRAQVDQALARVTSDPLAWKAVLLTAEIEAGGRDPFGIVVGNPGTGDIEFGIGFWSLRGETLQPILKRMREADAERFDQIMGEDRQAVLQWLDMPRDDASAFVRQRMLVRSIAFGVAEPWKSRFRALGAETAFQRIQMREMDRLWVSRTRRVVPQLDLRSERAFAFVYDTMIQQGLSAVTSARVRAAFDGFESRVGRKPDEQEKLLLLANVASERASFRRRDDIRQRRLAFALGEGTVYGRRVNLLNAGFGMRDLDSGAPLALVNDRAVVQRLTDGWLP